MADNDISSKQYSNQRERKKTCHKKVRTKEQHPFCQKKKQSTLTSLLWFRSICRTWIKQLRNTISLDRTQFTQFCFWKLIISKEQHMKHTHKNEIFLSFLVLLRSTPPLANKFRAQALRMHCRTTSRRAPTSPSGPSSVCSSTCPTDENSLLYSLHVQTRLLWTTKRTTRTHSHTCVSSAVCGTKQHLFWARLYRLWWCLCA